MSVFGVPLTQSLVYKPDFPVTLPSRKIKHENVLRERKQTAVQDLRLL